MNKDDESAVEREADEVPADVPADQARAEGTGTPGQPDTDADAGPGANAGASPDGDGGESVPASWRHAFLADGRERRWPLLGELLERTDEALAAALKTRFRAHMPVSSRTIVSRNHDAVLGSIAPDALYAACTLDPLPGEVWWVIDRALVFGLADRWFGGQGVTEYEPRALSGSEQRVFESLVESLRAALVTAWEPIAPVRAVASPNATAERFARDRPAGGRIDTGFTVQCGSGSAGIRLLVVPRTLAPLERDAFPPGGTAEDGVAVDERLIASMLGCDVPLSGVLAESTITLGDVMKLAPGDFIALDEKQTVSFRAGDRPVFDAVMGTVDGKASASVTRLHDPKRRR